MADYKHRAEPARRARARYAVLRQIVRSLTLYGARWWVDVSDEGSEGEDEDSEWVKNVVKDCIF